MTCPLVGFCTSRLDPETAAAVPTPRGRPPGKARRRAAGCAAGGGAARRRGRPAAPAGGHGQDDDPDPGQRGGPASPGRRGRAVRSGTDHGGLTSLWLLIRPGARRSGEPGGAGRRVDAEDDADADRDDDRADGAAGEIVIGLLIKCGSTVAPTSPSPRRECRPTARARSPRPGTGAGWPAASPRAPCAARSRGPAR